MTVKQQKSRASVCSSLDSEGCENLLPVLIDRSHILKEHHLDKVSDLSSIYHSVHRREDFHGIISFSQLASHMPARTQEYHWKLVYSTARHGTSLTTLYRHMTDIDRPVLLVIKDMDNQVTSGSFQRYGRDNNAPRISLL